MPRGGFKKDTVLRTYSIPRRLAEVIDQQPNRSDAVSVVLLDNIHRFESADLAKERALIVDDIMEHLYPVLRDRLEGIIKEIILNIYKELYNERA